RLQRNRYLNAYDMNEEKMQAFAEMLTRWKPAIFRAYPSALTLFAQYIRDQGIEGIRPKFIETTAEKITPYQREILEDLFQCKVADWYSAREFGTVGFQCPEGGLHICETRYLEIIHNGKTTQPGEMGEVVITSLTQYAMPLIRYKLNDTASFSPRPCTCGRNLPVLQDVVGRLSDFLVTEDGRLIYGGFIEYIFWEKPEVKKFQVYQPDKQHLEIRVVLKHEMGPGWAEKLRKQIQPRFGPTVKISVQMVDEINLTPAGKHRFTISDVKLENFNAKK
ncbi:MAG: phenylacetate--CoA ligase family protein, partial [Candidatus Aminicenantes bacterium]|nr:phenylacetate--CoA ligase family protein [Candidatus Aminicenantes bacterium]